MTKTGQRILTVILCATLALLSACGASPQGADGGDGAGGDTSQGTGRYLEERVSLPPVLYPMMLEQEQGGDLVLFASQESDENGSPWGLYRSSDLGRTWNAERPGWLDELGLTYIQMATLAPQGGMYVYYTEPNEDDVYWEAEDADDWEGNAGADEVLPAQEEDPADGMTAEEYGAWFEEDYVAPPAHFVHVDGDVITELEYELPASSWGYAGDGILVADNGDLLYMVVTELQQLDKETGSLKHTYEPDAYLTNGYFSSAHGRLALFEEESIAFYDLGSGQRIGELAITSESELEAGTVIVMNEAIGHQAIAFDPEDPDAVYFALSSGLYRGAIGSPVVERLIDGELTSLNMPSVNIMGLFPQADGSFLVYAGGDERVLLHFTYDPDVPTTPSTELKIYSLEDNRSVRQFMGMYQLQNPDVKVSYTVGAPEGSAVTKMDALRTLSTELLGGNGPDILVLDGLPAESYIRQGALADLGDIYDELHGGLLDNVASAYRDGDHVYAIPARFTVPVLLAPGDAAAQIGSIAELVEWAENRDNFAYSVDSGYALLSALYPLLADDWFDENEGLDREAFGGSLELVSRLYEAMGDDNMGVDDNQLMFQSIFYTTGNMTVVVSDLNTMEDISAPYSALKMREGTLSPMPGADGSTVFLPGTVLAVSTGSSQQEIALDFIRFALGEEAQSYSLSDGLAVHRGALVKSTESPYEEGEEYGGYSIGISTFAGDDEDDMDEGYVDDDTQAVIAYEGSMNIQWPDDAFLEELLASFEELRPVTVNAVIRQIVTEECEAYFGGTATLEETVSGVSQKIDLYLAEQG